MGCSVRPGLVLDRNVALDERQSEKREYIGEILKGP